MKRALHLTGCSLLLFALILEILPYGATLRFATDEEILVRTFSYFSFIPFGYANFSPMITGILTASSLFVSLYTMIKRKNSKSKLLLYFNLVVFVISLAPLLDGVEYYNGVAFTVSLLLLLSLLTNVVSCFLHCNKPNIKEKY